MNELIDPTRRFTLAKVEDWLVSFSAALIFVLMIITVIDVAGRYLFSSPLYGNIEISELLLVAIIALSLAGTQRVGGHIGMDAVLDKLKKSGSIFYLVLRIFTLFLSAVLFVIITYYCLQSFVESVNMNEKTPGPLYIFAWPAKGALFLGLLLISVRLVIQFIQAILSLRSRRN